MMMKDRHGWNEIRGAFSRRGKRAFAGSEGFGDRIRTVKRYDGRYIKKGHPLFIHTIHNTKGGIYSMLCYTRYSGGKAQQQLLLQPIPN